MLLAPLTGWIVASEMWAKPMKRQRRPQEFAQDRISA
jgi:hypothetical protein